MNADSLIQHFKDGLNCDKKALAEFLSKELEEGRVELKDILNTAVELAHQVGTLVSNWLPSVPAKYESTPSVEALEPATEEVPPAAVVTPETPNV